MRLLIAMICAAGVARADVDSDTAKRLFEEAVDDFAAGHIDAACPKLETSTRLRPASKPVGLLAACYEKQGKLATAWRLFKDARLKAETEKDNDTAIAAAGHVARLEPKLARITIVVKPGAVATLDGKPFTELDKPYEVDAGTRKVTASLGADTWDKSIAIKDGDNERVELLGAPNAKPIPKPTPTQPRKSLRKPVALGVVGGGVALAGVGLFFGSQANSKWSDAKAAGCNDDGVCPSSAGIQLVDQANSKATLSTVFVGVGAVAIAAGVVLYLTAPKRAERVALTIGRGGLQLVGGF